MYAKYGYYPKLEATPEISKRYSHDVVLHIRNIEKTPERPNPERNMDLEFASEILRLLYKAGKSVVIVGADRVHDSFGMLPHVKDYRNTLSILGISRVIMESKLFIGRDSGMVHLAAACGCPIVAFDFQNKKWFPKMPEDKFTAFMQGAERSEILKAIRSRL